MSTTLNPDAKNHRGWPAPGTGKQWEANTEHAPPYRLHSQFVSLLYEQRTHVGTACAAFHLGRKPQTLRVWACLENGPLRPNRVNGRLAWSVGEIRALLQLE